MEDLITNPSEVAIYMRLVLKVPRDEFSVRVDGSVDIADGSGIDLSVKNSVDLDRIRVKIRKGGSFFIPSRSQTTLENSPFRVERCVLEGMSKLTSLKGLPTRIETLWVNNCQELSDIRALKGIEIRQMFAMVDCPKAVFYGELPLGDDYSVELPDGWSGDSAKARNAVLRVQSYDPEEWPRIIADTTSTWLERNIAIQCLNRS